MKSLLSLGRCFWIVSLLAAAFAPVLTRADEDFLDPEVAFKLAARAVDDRTVELVFTIAPGYYLYREQFKFSSTDAKLGEPVLPAGKTKFDETFQKTVETYRDIVRVQVPVQSAGPAFHLMATNQGCADRGLCYPPQQRDVEVGLAGFGGDGSARVLGAVESPAPPVLATAPASAAVAPPAYAADDATIDRALRSGKYWSVTGVFFLAGLLLSLTPCVLPMLPILSSIIVGHGARASRARGLALASSYSFGMALVYTALGVAAGLAGEGLAAALQKPWVLILFALALAALSLSMFGIYELRVPSAMAGRLSSASARLPAGRFAGVFLMGGLSALIVSPCVAAPLAGALVYLSQTRNVWLGGAALFSLAAGMSVPLLLVGASAGALLPRAGAWMEDVKRFFGVLLLAVALWTVQAVLPAALGLALWGALVLSAAVMLASHRSGLRTSWTAHLGRRAMALTLAVYGVLQLVGAASGGADPLQPLAQFRVPTAAGGPSSQLPFRTVRSVADLDDALREAGRPTMLDFYADWCVSCKEMERYTFVDVTVQKRLAAALLLRVDVTANTEADRALLRRFSLFGPPGTIFFDPQGKEVPAARVAGFQDGPRFLQTLSTAGL